MVCRWIYRILVRFKFNLLVITGSADATCKITDIVAGFKAVSMMKAKDAVFSIETIYNMTIAGCGDGNILFYDNDSG